MRISRLRLLKLAALLAAFLAPLYLSAPPIAEPGAIIAHQVFVSTDIAPTASFLPLALQPAPGDLAVPRDLPASDCHPAKILASFCLPPVQHGTPATAKLCNSYTGSELSRRGIEVVAASKGVIELYATHLPKGISVVNGKTFIPSQKIKILVDNFEKAGGLIDPVPRIKTITLKDGTEIRQLGAFTFNLDKPTVPVIRLWEGATESVFVEEYIHWLQAKSYGNVKNLSEFESWIKRWGDNNIGIGSEILEDEAEVMLREWGYGDWIK